MPLLLNADYEYLASAGLTHEEDPEHRFLVIRGYPVKEGMYQFNGSPVEKVDILSIVPENYNTSGCDMFWVCPAVSRADGGQIPATGGDDRVYEGVTFVRWSRHWQRADKPKVDGVQKTLDRIEWALRHPDPAEKV
jgi:hypothetical protein